MLDVACMEPAKLPPRFSTIEALSAFVEEQRLPLLAYIHRNLGPALKSKLEAEDILQDVALAAVAAPEQFEVADRDPFKLLCQMCEQRIIDAYRHHVTAQKRSAAREVSMDGRADGDNPFGFINLLVASLTSPSQAFSRDQRGIQLQEAVEALSEEQRVALRLRYVDGWPTRDIAQRLNKSDGAIRVLLSRTLAQLQTILAETR